MENPACWNSTVKILNSHLYVGVSLEKVIAVLVDNKFLLISPSEPAVINAIQHAIDNDKYECENQACGNSIGLKVYNELKKINAVL